MPIEEKLRQSVDFRPLFRSGSSDEIEAACKYEYMRESRTLIDAVARLGSKETTEAAKAYRQNNPTWQSPFFLSFSEPQFFRLVVQLQRLGLQKPWLTLDKESRAPLVPLLAKSKNQRSNYLRPPITLEAATVEFDHEGTTADQPWHWRLEPREPELIQKHEQSNFNDFIGFIRIRERCNQTEAIKAFRAWFSDHFPKTKGGGGPKWRNRLEQLAVMRICASFRSFRDQWKRVQLIAEVCSYAGCRREAAEYNQRRHRGHGDEPMSEQAQVEMSAAIECARTYFREVFPNDEPASYRSWTARKENRT